jgi:hypothetical protein
MLLPHVICYPPDGPAGEIVARQISMATRKELIAAVGARRRPSRNCANEPNAVSSQGTLAPRERFQTRTSGCARTDSRINAFKSSSKVIDCSCILRRIKYEIYALPREAVTTLGNAMAASPFEKRKKGRIGRFILILEQRYAHFVSDGTPLSNSLNRRTTQDFVARIRAYIFDGGKIGDIDPSVSSLHLSGKLV